MAVTATSSVKIHGFVQVRVHDAQTGALLYQEDKPNLICQGSRTAMSRLAAQRSGEATDDPEYNKVWAIYVGDNATVPASDQTWLLASPANITRKAVEQPVSIVPPDDSGIVQVTTTFGTGDHLNKYIREIGLFTRGDNDEPGSGDDSTILMLARQIHGEIYKTSAIAVTYTWRYQFTS